MAKKVVYFQYNQGTLLEAVSKFDVKQVGNIVTTFFDKRVLATIEVSIKYFLFEFGTFAKGIIESIENYFSPTEYCLRINKGYQEIRLVGEKVHIGEEEYYKMFSLVNSSDKTRALRMNIGLIRKNTNTPFVISVDNEFASVAGKHFVKSLPDKLKEFVNILPEFNVIINNQVSALYSLFKKSVSLKDVYTKMLHYDEDGVVIAGDILRLRMLTKMILRSDAVDITTLSKEEQTMLNYPVDFINQKTTKVFDLNINAKKLFDLYTEIYKNYDSSVIERETRRIYNALS